MAKNIKRKMAVYSLIFLVVVFSFGYMASTTVVETTTHPTGITIVIDAGHGGADGGSVGVTTGITESELNLIYAKKLTKYLENFGINVVNTRNDMNGLYDKMTDDFKLVDMQKRVQIIKDSDAQLLVSIHMNKYTSSAENGAQVFFEQNNTDSQQLATCIKNMLRANFENARELVLAGDYYILNETYTIGVIVECGFLSNPEEEKKLQDSAYQDKMCYSIFAGIINYLGLANDY